MVDATAFRKHRISTDMVERPSGPCSFEVGVRLMDRIPQKLAHLCEASSKVHRGWNNARGVWCC